MTAEDYLNRVKTEYEHVQSMLDRLYDMKARATSCGGSRYSDEPGGGSGFGDKLAAAVASYVDYSKKCFEEVQKFIDFRAGVVQKIESLPDPLQVTVLKKIYVEFKTTEQVAFEITRSKRQTLRIKKKALNNFEVLLLQMSPDLL